jgi:hypothetical protein
MVKGSIEPVPHIYVRDPNSKDDGEKYGCKVYYQGTDPIDRSIADWEKFFEIQNDELAPKIHNALAVFRALRDGSWKEIVRKAEDQMITGEDVLKKALLYSGFSSGLKDERLHVYIMGESQQGKSFIQEKVGSLFLNIFMFASSMSAKSPYAEAEANKDPGFYNHKILGLDELADQSEATRDFVKAASSNDQKKMVNKTLDDRKKFNLQALEGMPVFWTNSMEVFEDQGSQLANRFFKLSIDESIEQSERVEGFQKDNSQYGGLKKPRADKERAIEIIATILGEKDFKVLNPFAPLIHQTEIKARNVLPMLFTLVYSIAYANRFSRPSFKIDGEEKYIVATLSDNLEALEIWGYGTQTQGTGLPPSHNRILDAMEMDKEYTVDQVRESHNTKHPKNQLAASTINNYLHNLANKNLVTSSRPQQCSRPQNHSTIDDDPKNNTEKAEYPRGYVYRLLPSSQLHNTSQLDIVKQKEEVDKILDDWITNLKQLTSQLHNDIEAGFFDGLKDRLIDLPLSIGPTEEIPLDEKVQKLRDKVKAGKLRYNDIERIDPQQKTFIDNFIHKGQIVVKPNGFLDWP